MMLGVEYETTATIDEFYAFYEKSGWIDVEKTDNSIIFNNIKATSSDPNNSFSPDFKFKMQFRQTLDLKLFSIEKI